MAQFLYKAITRNGTALNGSVDADDEQAAILLLAADGKKIIDITAASDRRSARAKSGALIKTKLQAIFFEDVSVLLNAGMTIDQALRAIGSGTDDRQLKQTLSAIVDDISSGVLPSKSFENTGKFSPEVVALIASGENTSSLGRIFEAMAKDATERVNLQQRLVEALTYPAFLTVLAICSVMLIAFALVPALMPIFETVDAEPPAVLALLSALRSGILEFGGVIVFFFLMLVLLATLPTARSFIRRQLLRVTVLMPIVGSIYRKLVMARYLRSFSLLTGNKVDMPSALELSAAVVPIAGHRERLENVVAEVSQGRRVPDALKQMRLLDDDILSILQIGDEVNRLALVSERAAIVLQTKAQREIDRALAVLTPAITIGLGLLIGILVVSVMTTLLSVNDLAVGQ